MSPSGKSKSDSISKTHPSDLVNDISFGRHIFAAPTFEWVVGADAMDVAIGFRRPNHQGVGL